MPAARPSSMPATIRCWLHLGLALAVCLGAGCNGSTLPAAPQIPDTGSSTLFSLQVTATAHSLPVGSTLQLQAQGLTDRDTPLAVSPTWKTSDPKVATVSAKGVLQGLKAGSVTVTANVANPPRVATITVRVLGAGETPPPEPVDDGSGTGGGVDAGGDFPTPDLSPAPGGFTPPDGSGDLPDAGGSPAPAGLTLAIYPQNPRVGVGDRLRLVALQGQGDGSPGAPTGASWRTSDASIATVDEAGNVSGLAPGTVTITASSLAFPALRSTTQLSVVAPVKASDIQGIRITPSKVTMNVGETFWLLAEVPTTGGGFDPHIRWESGDSNVVTVTDTGQITAVGPGRTTVTATATTYDHGDLSASVPVEVKNTATAF